MSIVTFGILSILPVLNSKLSNMSQNQMQISKQHFGHLVWANSAEERPQSQFLRALQAVMELDTSTFYVTAVLSTLSPLLLNYSFFRGIYFLHPPPPDNRSCKAEHTDVDMSVTLAKVTQVVRNLPVANEAWMRFNSH